MYARASRMKRLTSTAPARSVGSTPAAAHRATTASALPVRGSFARDERSIFRRWRNAAAVTKSSAGASAADSGGCSPLAAASLSRAVLGGCGTMDTSVVPTFGGGTNAFAGME